MPEKTICVYCSSSDAVAPAYFMAARELGILIAQHNFTLIYGGTRVGLMGEVARAVHANQGRIIGVLPETLRLRGIGYEMADELLVTPDLRQRKAQMETQASAFIALPGGFGTLEELLEVLTLKQLQEHRKAVVLLNIAGFYDRLINVFEHFYAENFAKAQYRRLYHVTPDPADAIAYIESYKPPLLESKWY